MMGYPRIKQLRQEQKISRDALIKEIGISHSALATYENGTREPSAELIVKLAQHFNVSSDYILGLSDESTRERPWPPPPPEGSDNPSELFAEVFSKESNAFDEIMKCIARLYDAATKIYESSFINEYGCDTIKAYTTILELLAGIDEYAAVQLSELQKRYPALKHFGYESSMIFEGKYLLEAIASNSKEALEFTKYYKKAIESVASHTKHAIEGISGILSSIYPRIAGHMPIVAEIEKLTESEDGT